MDASKFPFLYQVVVAILISEFIIYMDHRLSHTVVGLRKIHSIHHMSTRVTALNNARHHFLDNIKALFPTYFLFFSCNFHPSAVFWSQLIIVVVALVSHSNLNICCHFWNRFFITPDLHRWHHSYIKKERDTNFGAAFLIWDVLFKTR